MTILILKKHKYNTMLKLSLTAAAVMIPLMLWSQTGQRLQEIKGYRLKANTVVPLYLNNPVSNTINSNHTRLMDKTVFFNPVQLVPSASLTSKKYILINIPGKLYVFDSGKSHIDAGYDGQNVSPIDYGKTFWIDSVAIINLDTVYRRFKNDIVLGAMTLPFKYRPIRGTNASSLIDGSFNVGPYVGFKIRLTEDRPFFFTPVISGGITTINFASANNSGITDATKTETSGGFQYCAGFVFDFYKVEIGGIIGADHATGDLSKTYIYQDAVWFGMSLNYNFLNYKADKKDTGN